MQLSVSEKGEGPVLVLLHGLFGDQQNLGGIARPLSKHFRVLSVDLRNHGNSPHDSTMSYPLMADDLVQLLDRFEVERCHILGHSMGGKVAMQLAKDHPERVISLIVADIAPVVYSQHRHQQVFAALKAVTTQEVHSRTRADMILSQTLQCAATRSFLLKSLKRSGDGHFQWKFNLPAIETNYNAIMGWPKPENFYDGPALFIKGENSEYIQPQHQPVIHAQFPKAEAKIILDAGHWLHIEKQRLFLNCVQQFHAKYALQVNRSALAMI